MFNPNYAIEGTEGAEQHCWDGFQNLFVAFSIMAIKKNNIQVSFMVKNSSSTSIKKSEFRGNFFMNVEPFFS